MRLTQLIFFASIIACGKGSSGDNNPQTNYSLNFSGIGYEQHNTQNLHFALVERMSGKTKKIASTIVSDGKFSVSFPDSLEVSTPYLLDFYADHNNNGSCDSDPLVDHAWRLPIERVQGDVTLSDVHNMDFTAVCPSFSASGEENDSGPMKTIAISGTLSLSNGVSTIPQLKAGQALNNAVVFAEGYPKQETMTRTDGSFALSLRLPVSQALSTENLHLVMWYTQKEDGDNQSATWDRNIVRVGARRPITIDSTEIDIGSVSLNYTKRARFSLADAANGSPITPCWIELPAFSFHLHVHANGDGSYDIDYLPPGDYSFTTHCSGYNNVSKEFTVGIASSHGEITDLGTVMLMKNSSSDHSH